MSSKKVNYMYNLIKTFKTFKGTVSIYDSDTTDDLQDIDVTKIAQGSIVNVISEGKSYVLNSNKQWISANRFIEYWEV